MIIEDCQFVGHKDTGIRLQKDGDIEILGKMYVAGSGGEDDTDMNIYFGDTTVVDASSATIISQDCVNGPGILNHSSESINIGTYYHAGNAGGAIDDGSGTLDIGTTTAERQSELSFVPGPNDVGAFTDASSSGGDTSDQPLFDDWTPRWESGHSGWAVNSTSSNVEDNILELDAASSGRHALSCDPIGTATDVDMLGLVRVPSDDDNSSSWCRLVGRGSGTAGNETGYFIAFRDAPHLDMVKYSNGSATGLANTSADAPVGSWLYVRFNITGNELKARYWNYGEEEPTTWDLTATDSEITDAGWVGAGGWSTDTQQWDMFSVGTGGESAQLVGADSSASVAWNSPADGTTVSDTVTLKIAASDLEDSDDSLITEYRIDGNSWSTASYNSTSGYYEADWDSTTVTNGDHTLGARVTDSAGNSSTATMGVKTDNSGNAPAVDSLSLAEVETSNSDAEFDVDWQVSDSDSNLSSVDFELIRDSDGTTADMTSVNVSGDRSTEITRLIAEGDDSSGNSYTVMVTVTDEKGNATNATTSTTETEGDGSAPIIYRFSVSEAGRPDPHAEVTSVWDVSDTDGDLSSVEIDVADSKGTVQGVTWTLSGGKASDTDSFKIKEGDGETFDVTITVTDEAGQSTRTTTSVTA